MKPIYLQSIFQDLSNWVPNYDAKYLSNETHYPYVALYNVEKDPGNYGLIRTCAKLPSDLSSR